MNDADRGRFLRLERRVDDLRAELFGMQRTLQLVAFVAVIFALLQSGGLLASAVAGEVLRSLGGHVPAATAHLPHVRCSYYMGGGLPVCDFCPLLPGQEPHEAAGFDGEPKGWFCKVIQPEAFDVR